ncbi:MAG: glycosyltransferase family 4 protein [Gemmatimonadaceae bacterium]|nr:glycosyltransferase family 4 protein [Gemmatimonadaceae bacterium]
MRIVHVLNHVRQIGNGIVNITVDLACAQAAAGHEVTVVSMGGEFAALLEARGVRHVRIDQTRRPRTLWRAHRAFGRLLRDVSPDIVHVHMVTALILVMLHRPFARWRVVASVHNEFQRSSNLMGWADRVIAMSTDGVERLVARGIARAKLTSIRNAVLGGVRDPSAATTRAQLVHPAIVTVSGVYERKGIGDLIAAFTRIAPTHPDTHCYIVGDGPDRARYEAEVSASPVADRVHFEGFRADAGSYLRAADLFVLASHAEAGGLVLGEARAAGCAIIATGIDGTPELLDQGRAGILVPVKDSTALAATIDRLLRDPEERERWRAAARTGLDDLSILRQHREVITVYETALRR